MPGRIRSVTQNTTQIASGGLPEQKAMTNGGLKTTASKAGWGCGLGALNPFSKERTWKRDGKVKQIQQDWRGYDLPPSNLLQLGEASLQETKARTNLRGNNVNASVTVSAGVQAWQGLDQVFALKSEIDVRKGTLGRHIRNAEALAGQREHLTTCITTAREEQLQLNTSLAEVEQKISGLKTQVTVLNSSLNAHREGSLGRTLVQTSLDEANTALAGLENERRVLDRKLGVVNTAVDATTAAMDGIGDALDELTKAVKGDKAAVGQLEIQLASAQTQYEKARIGTVRSALQQFFDVYADLREHHADSARMKGMTRIIPRLADTLELPKKYLDGMNAKEQADRIVDLLEKNRFRKMEAVVDIVQDTLSQRADGDSGLARTFANLSTALKAEKLQLYSPFSERKAEIADVLTGQHARQLTAGRLSVLPDPPRDEEVRRWSEESTKLRGLALACKEQINVLNATVPDFENAAIEAQRYAMQELVKHLPHSNRIASLTLREETQSALERIAGQLVTAANGTLKKDAPLAPMQLVHVVEMTHVVTGGDAQRNVSLYKALAEGSVRDVMRRHVDAAQQPTELDRDLGNLYRLASHQTPEAVTSLLAASPRHSGAEKVDWRDVQTFWRCVQEHDCLGSSDAETAHKQQLTYAMRGLVDEVANGVKPLPGSLEKRFTAMAKSAVWELKTKTEINALMERFVDKPLPLSGSQVSEIHNLFSKKGRGHPVEDARKAFSSALDTAGQAARETLSSPGVSQEQRGAAAVLLAVCGYFGSHQGAGGVLSLAKRLVNGEARSFKAGWNYWSNPLGAKDKSAILRLVQQHLGGAQGGFGNALSGEFSKLKDTNGSHNALELFEEAVLALEKFSPSRLPVLGDSGGLELLKARGELAKGNGLGTPDAVRRFLHDAIDRTELGDRMDTVVGSQMRVGIPGRINLKATPPVNLNLALYALIGKGVIVNVQANNDCVQLTLGKTKEAGIGGAFGAGVGFKKKQTIGPVKLSTTVGPSGTLRAEHKRRKDPAVVLKYSIEPVRGLRDLGDARSRLKNAVDLLLDWKNLRDGDGQPYASPFDAMADRLDPPPTIDYEVRKYTGNNIEGGLSAGISAKVSPSQKNLNKAQKNAAKLGLIGAGVVGTIKGGVTNDVMRAKNQQGAEEVYITKKNYAKIEGFAGLSAPPIKANGTGMPATLGIHGALSANIGGKEVKYKFPVGTDRYRAYKLEYGLFGRDMKVARDLVFSMLPQVMTRVQGVCKGVGLNDELSQLMEAEVVMNFARMLRENKTDRFSTKAESSQQWAHRGLDAGIRMAGASGDEEMASALRGVRDAVTAGDKDQAVKYFVAAGELATKKSSLLIGNRVEIKSMSEDPIPDTRTATLQPTATRLLRERENAEGRSGWQVRVSEAALRTAASTRPSSGVLGGEPQNEAT